MNTAEKIQGIERAGGTRKILVTHITIRQSISFLMMKLILLEVIAAACVILFHTAILSIDIAQQVSDRIVLFNIPLFTLLVCAKTILMISVVLQWLNEYYEITPKEIVHTTGVIFRKEERNTLNHLGKLQLDYGLFGKVFNYGTLKLYNWVLNKNVKLYLIHNPLKYHSLLMDLLPEADQEKQTIREHIIEFEK